VGSKRAADLHDRRQQVLRRNQDVRRDRLRAGETSSDATGLPILLAALAALALPWLLVALTALTVHRILLLQAVVFFALAVVLGRECNGAGRPKTPGRPETHGRWRRSKHYAAAIRAGQVRF
jgi:hypothetical protein